MLPSFLSASTMVRRLSTVCIAVGVAAERPDRQGLELGRRLGPPRPADRHDGGEPLGLGGGEVPASRGRPSRGRSGSRAWGRPCRSSSRRRAPRARRCCRPSRPTQFCRACGKTTRAGTPPGPVEDRRADPDLRRHDSVLAALAGAVQEQDHRETSWCRRSPRARRPCISARPGRS